MSEPGMLPAPDDQFRLIAAFRQRFRVYEPRGTLDRAGWLEPSWKAFGRESIVVVPSALGELRLSKSTRLLL